MFTWEEWEDMAENYTAVQEFISEWFTGEEYDEEMYSYE